jgi:hypothetical protein
MRKLLFIIMLAAIISSRSNAQGCIAIKNNGSTCTMIDHDESGQTKNSGWNISFNDRYFKSYKHYSGTEEQKQRVDSGTNVINHVNSLDIDLIRIINDRWSIGLFTPILSNTRSSLYEHKDGNRHTTSSFGIGDMRVAAYYWLFNPRNHREFNVQAGLGLKFPTGDYRYQDYFIKSDSSKTLGPVDQSIQLGDGGTGITLELNGFYRFSHNSGLYANFYYLSNPREVNGVSTSRGDAPRPSAITNGSDVMSVPDQYMIRAGGDYRVNNFTFSGGVRMECVPVYDLIGGSNGFRRPGYVISAEPAVAYKYQKTLFYLAVPVALERNRTQSVPDKISSQITGKKVQGDAAFADYTINFGVSVMF